MFEQITRGLLEGRAVVTGMGRFDPALAPGAYQISGILETTIEGATAGTPFALPVEIDAVPSGVARQLRQRPAVTYTSAEEAFWILE